MNCNEARSVIKGSVSCSHASRLLAHDHIADCNSCRQAVGEDEIVARILRVSGDAHRKSSEATSLPPLFMMQLRSRIRRESDRLASTRRTFTNTWEAGILQFQKVVYASGALALVLLGFMVYAEYGPGYGNDTRTGTQAGIVESLLSDRGERLLATQAGQLSQDEVLFAVVNEENENARR